MSEAIKDQHAGADQDRLERAILTTARVMTEFNLPQILPTLKRLEAERDDLLKNGDAISYAERVLSKLSRKSDTSQSLERAAS
jgi:adenylosuccinate lyase